MLLIQPKSAKDEVVGLQEERLKIKITAPPVEMAVVFQEYGRSLFPWLRVAENVELPLKNAGMRIEPPTSEPRPKGEMPAPTAAPSPPELPPTMRPWS